jgi:hypothetical protein
MISISVIATEFKTRTRERTMDTKNRPIAVYTSRGDVGAFLVYPYLFNQIGEWIGWITPQKDVYSVLGVFVGKLASPPRIVRRRAEDYDHPRKTPPPAPVKIYPPATVPLAPMMPELSFDAIDVLLEEPELLHPIDSGDLREDID